MSDSPKHDPNTRGRTPDPVPVTQPSSDHQSVPSPSAHGDNSRKKSRLQWDEQNLLSNAAEMERAGPRMKIDEPKTPFAGSETGSSTSGSAHQSPPESPNFIPGEQLVGFQTLEQRMRRSSTNSSSDANSSTGSAGRIVHISDDLPTSGGSTPRSREEFEARRKAHYRNEARVRMEEWRRTMTEEDEEDGNDDDHDDNDEQDNRENGTTAPQNPIQDENANGVREASAVTETSHLKTNGHKGGSANGQNQDG